MREGAEVRFDQRVIDYASKYLPRSSSRIVGE
jgi:hypothetical protein